MILIFGKDILIIWYTNNSIPKMMSLNFKQVLYIRWNFLK